MPTAIRDFTDLLIWQKAVELGLVVYRITQKFPRDERFALTSQLRRAVVSVSSNIAEGHSLQGKEFPHFLSIAKGSLAEVESQLLFASRLGYVASESVEAARSSASEIHRMIASLIEKLQ